MRSRSSLLEAVASLKDPYSHYFSPRNYGAFEDDTQGRFQGIGTTVTEVKQGLKINQVYAHSPAARAGLHAGDIIVSVNGTPLAGKTSDQSTTLIIPSWTTVASKMPSWLKNRPVASPRPPEALGEVQSYRTQSSALIGWWNHIAWSRLAPMILSTPQ